LKEENSELKEKINEMSVLVNEYKQK